MRIASLLLAAIAEFTVVNGYYSEESEALYRRDYLGDDFDLEKRADYKETCFYDSNGDGIADDSDPWDDYPVQKNPKGKTPKSKGKGGVKTKSKGKGGVKTKGKTDYKTKSKGKGGVKTKGKADYKTKSKGKGGVKTKGKAD